MILAIGLLANLLLHHWAFDILSERFGWYRSMAVILLGMSVDIYLLCLTGLAHSTFEAYSEAGIFRDLHIAAIRPWAVMKPLLEVFVVLLIGDTVIEGLVAAVTGHEPALLSLLGFAGSMLYAIIASLFLGLILLGMNLLRIWRLMQYFIIVMVSFVTLFAVSFLADLWEPAIRRESAGIGSVFALLSRLVHASAANFATEYAYYAGLLVEGVVLACISVPLYQFVRRLAERRFSTL